MRTSALLYIAILFLTANAFAQPVVGTWADTGPVPFPINVSGQVNGMGRVSQIKFHHSNPAKIYAVSSSGGLYITNDTGHTWTPTAGTDALPTTSCSAVCLDYTSDNILYLSTGDQNYYGEGLGMWKSTDGGATWNPSSTGIGNRMSVDIIMSPTNHNVLIAATDDGIWRTTDGAATWTQTQAGTFRSMKQRPGSNNVLYAATDTLFYRSNDMGITWTNITAGVTPPIGNEGMRIAVTPADTTLVFLGATGGYGEVFKSTNGGTSFSNIYSSTAQCVVCYDSTITSGSQGYYNYNLTVNPTNPNELLIVSHCVWRSTDGGHTWSWRTQWWNQVHTDMHDIEFDPYDVTKRFNANDGGVWLSRDTLASNWVPFCNGMACTEVYHAAQSPVTRQLISLGSQDNGELFFDGTWKTNRGGDWGPRCNMDYLGNGTVYYDNGNRRNLSPLGGDYTYNPPFTAPPRFHIEFPKTSPNTAFIGTDSVWRSTDISSTMPTWTFLNSTGNYIQDIVSCKADTNILYYVTDNNLIFRSDNAMSATPTFTTLATPGSTGFTASLATDKYNANVVYLSCNEKVYRSSNKGISWTNITGALPTINTLKLVADEYSPNERLFLCQGSKVWWKDNSTAWTATLGIPSVAQFTDMVVYNDSTSASILRVSSYGRGVWELNINNNYPPTGDFTSNQRYICAGDTIKYYKTSFGNPSSFVWSFPGGTPSTSTSDSPVVVYPTVGTYVSSLTLVGATGNDTIVKTNYVVVSNGGGSIAEDFEGSTFPPNSQWVQQSATGILWKHNLVVGGFGASSKCMFYDNFNNDGGGHHDLMILPKIDLSSATIDTAYITFNVAYGYYPGYHDSLSLDISTDCGRTFHSIYERDSATLATAPDTTGFFQPTATQWRKDSVSLMAYVGQGIELAFDNIGHYGQGIYIDNVNVRVHANTVSVTTPYLNTELTLYPNPTDGIIKVSASNAPGNTATVSCFDVMGQLVASKQVPVTAGSIKSSIDLTNRPAGLYEVKIQFDNGTAAVERFLLRK